MLGAADGNEGAAATGVGGRDQGHDNARRRRRYHCCSIDTAILTRYGPGSSETICPPPMAVRSKNRGGSTSVRGRVRSPHVSGNRRWLSCRQPACLEPRQLRHGTDRRTDRQTTDKLLKLLQFRRDLKTALFQSSYSSP